MNTHGSNQPVWWAGRDPHICLQHQGRTYRKTNASLDFGFWQKENYVSQIDMGKRTLKTEGSARVDIENTL